MTKDELRKSFKAIRGAIPRAEMEAEAISAANRIAAIIEANPAIKTIAAFVSVRDEFPTGPVIAAALQAGRRICLPAWDQVAKTYHFAPWDGIVPLVNGPMGIPQPPGRNYAHPSEIDLFLVPGLAFDAEGNRLGYGGGWFDRLLSQARSDAMMFGLCHPKQISLLPLPCDAHDIKVKPLQLHIVAKQS